MCVCVCGSVRACAKIKLLSFLTFQYSPPATILFSRTHKFTPYSSSLADSPSASSFAKHKGCWTHRPSGPKASIAAEVRGKRLGEGEDEKYQRIDKHIYWPPYFRRGRRNRTSSRQVAGRQTNRKQIHLLSQK